MGKVEAVWKRPRKVVKVGGGVTSGRAYIGMISIDLNFISITNHRLDGQIMLTSIVPYTDFSNSLLRCPVDSSSDTPNQHLSLVPYLLQARTSRGSRVREDERNMSRWSRLGRVLAGRRGERMSKELKNAEDEGGKGEESMEEDEKREEEGPTGVHPVVCWRDDAQTPIEPVKGFGDPERKSCGTISTCKNSFHPNVSHFPHVSRLPFNDPIIKPLDFD